MCNVPLISVLFIAAQLGFAVAMGLVATAGALNASLFLAGKSPFVLAAAIAALGAAIASLRAASTESINCAFPSCVSPVTRFLFRVNQLLTALSALAIAIAATIAFAAIPLAAVVAISLILTGSLVALGLFIYVGAELLSVAVCVATRPVPLPPATIIAGILTVLLVIAVGGLVISGALAGLIPLVPLPLG
jgi:hypothetical protein